MFLVYFIELHEFIPVDSRAEKFISLCYITDKLEQVNILLFFFILENIVHRRTHT